MEFQLTQAKFRAVLGTVAVISGVAIPFFGYLGASYLEKMEAASIAVGRLTTEIAVLNTQMTYLRDDISDLQSTVKVLQSRADKALFIVEGKDAEVDLFTSPRIGSEVHSRQTWRTGPRVHGLSDFTYGG